MEEMIALVDSRSVKLPSSHPFSRNEDDGAVNATARRATDVLGRKDDTA